MLLSGPVVGGVLSGSSVGNVLSGTIVDSVLAGSFAGRVVETVAVETAVLLSPGTVVLV